MYEEPDKAKIKSNKKLIKEDKSIKISNYFYVQNS